MKVEAALAQHVGDRAEQQDRVDVVQHPMLDDVLLAVLADGAGGHTGGAMASGEVITRARQTFLDFRGREDLQELMHDVLMDAHQGILLSRFASEQDPFSTAVALIVRGATAQWAHCGDSRLYHVRDGQVIHRSEDHSFVAQLLRQGEITEAEINTHPKRNVLLSCLGGRKAPQVTPGQCEDLREGDVFLLCSDGLWAYFSDEELATTLSQRDVREVAQTLLREARTRAAGRGDNVSLAVVRLCSPPPPAVPEAPKWTLLD